jgi:acyl-CoA reductase-like NAD-dependent aldehyde dehydrogenase
MGAAETARDRCRQRRLAGVAQKTAKERAAILRRWNDLIWKTPKTWRSS